MNFFIKNNQIIGNEINIEGSDVNHIKNVLRKNIGDVISVISDEKIQYRAEIISLSNEVIKCEILEKKNGEKNDEPKITIFQGLAKADKIEYIIQKCTELGVYEIIPVEMKRCVVRLDEKDKLKKIERWKKIAEVASKQSLRNEILKIDKVINFNEMCNTFSEYDCVIMAYEKEKNIMLKDVLKNLKHDQRNIAVIIGPEGGFDDFEAELIKNNGGKTVSLGKRILRTETAPVAVSSIIMYELE